MEREQFDALARSIADQRSRRSAIAMLLGATVFGPLAASGAARRRGKGKGKARAKHRSSRTQAEAACCSSGTCTPRQGTNLTKCCYEDGQLAGQNFKGANLTSADFARATLTNANFSAANVSKACFVDADITGATFKGANTSGAIYCRTQTDSGLNNSGCDKGTPCCPTCDEEHPCGEDEICCSGRCVPGNCCGAGDCGDTGNACTYAVCTNFRCIETSEDPGTLCQSDTGICCASSGHLATCQVDDVNSCASCGSACPTPQSQALDPDCAAAVCTGRTCGFTFAAAGATCNDAGGAVCNGAGSCVPPCPEQDPGCRRIVVPGGHAVCFHQQCGSNGCCWVLTSLDQRQCQLADSCGEGGGGSSGDGCFKWASSTCSRIYPPWP